MDNFKWVFKWKKDTDGDTLFIPILLPLFKGGVDRYLTIWRSGVHGKFVSGLDRTRDIKSLKDAEPNSEDLRMAIESVFYADNFFEGL